MCSDLILEGVKDDGRLVEVGEGGVGNRGGAEGVVHIGEEIDIE